MSVVLLPIGMVLTVIGRGSKGDFDRRSAMSVRVRTTSQALVMQCLQLFVSVGVTVPVHFRRTAHVDIGLNLPLIVACEAVQSVVMSMAAGDFGDIGSRAVVMVVLLVIIVFRIGFCSDQCNFFWRFAVPATISLKVLVHR